MGCGNSERHRYDDREKKDDGWIEWKGGKCPVDDRTLVQYFMRIDMDTDIYRTDFAHDLRWSSLGGESDIVKYRLSDKQLSKDEADKELKTQEEEKENDWVEKH